MFKRIWINFNNYQKQVIFCFFATLLEAIFFLMIPTFVSRIFDTGLANQDKTYIYKMGCLMILCALIAMGIGIYENNISAIAAQGLGTNLRQKIFNQIMNFSSANTDEFTNSSLITRLNSDVNAVQSGAIQFMRMIFVGGWRMTIALILAIRINAKLTLIIVTAIATFIIFLLVAFSLVMPWFTIMQKEMDKLNTRTQDNTRAQRVVKSFVRGKYEEEKFNEPNNRLSYIMGKANGIIMSIVPLSAVVMNGTIAAVLWFGGKQTGVGSMSFGDLNTFLSYSMQVCAAIGMVSVCAGQLGKATAAAQRVFEVIDKDPFIQISSSCSSSMKPASGEIHFENVTFQYTDSAPRPALNNINLHIPSGQFLAIIGSTGEGKSSMLNLIPRFYEAGKGKIYVGGHDIKDYTLENLREAISYVPQSNVLFSGTIIENIKWGNPDANIHEIISACKMAQAHDFIMALEKGYDTWIEQGGTNVSGGQRQRLCIARALLKKSKILLLDDSTSALDATTEAKIRETLRTEFRDTTILLVSQKINSVIDADTILVMDEGQISGLGTHEELMKNNKIYQEIYYSQTREVA